MQSEPWQTTTPDVVAEIRLYAPKEGGRKSPLIYGFVCTATRDMRQGWDARFQLDGKPFDPGTNRRVGMVFLTPEGAAAIRQAGRFFLWEGRFIGEGQVVE